MTALTKKLAIVALALFAGLGVALYASDSGDCCDNGACCTSGACCRTSRAN